MHLFIFREKILLPFIICCLTFLFKKSICNYIFFIPYIFRKYKNFDYYMEYYFSKQICKIKNFFFNCYIDVEKIYDLKAAYPKDLKKYAKARVFNV